MDYNYISQFHMNPPTHALQRKATVQEIYDRERKTNAHQINIYNKIFNNVKTDWCVTKNDYPYHFIDNTQHFVIWFKNDTDFNMISDALKGITCTFFENNPNNKSILKHRKHFLYTSITLSIS